MYDLFLVVVYTSGISGVEINLQNLSHACDVDGILCNANILD